MKKHIITIGGRPGSGKSTTSKLVAELLRYTRFSSGDFMREIAQKRDVSIEELNIIAERETSIDEEIDEKLRRLRENDDMVIDSRLAFHWIPESFKVYLDLSREEAARRIFNDTNQARIETSKESSSFEDTLHNIEERLLSERKRYRELYQVDPYDPAHFNLVVDTEHTTQEGVAKKIETAYQDWLKA